MQSSRHILSQGSRRLPSITVGDDARFPRGRRGRYTFSSFFFSENYLLPGEHMLDKLSGFVKLAVGPILRLAELVQGHQHAMRHSTRKLLVSDALRRAVLSLLLGLSKRSAIVIIGNRITAFVVV
jgi:hypothetical protein